MGTKIDKMLFLLGWINLELSDQLIGNILKMRFILLVIILIGLGALLNYLSMQFTQAIILSLFTIFFIGPTLTSYIKLKRYKTKCTEWLAENGMCFKYIQPEPHMLSKGKLRNTVSDAQLVFSLRNSDEQEYWFACGSWWLGTFSNEIAIYQSVDGKLIYISKVYA